MFFLLFFFLVWYHQNSFPKIFVFQQQLLNSYTVMGQFYNIDGTENPHKSINIHIVSSMIQCTYIIIHGWNEYM